MKNNLVHSYESSDAFFQYGIGISFPVKNANDAKSISSNQIVNADGGKSCHRPGPQSCQFWILDQLRDADAGPLAYLADCGLHSCQKPLGHSQGYLPQGRNICIDAGYHRAPTVRLSLSPGRPPFTPLFFSGSNLCGFSLDFTPKLPVVWRVFI